MKPGKSEMVINIDDFELANGNYILHINGSAGNTIYAKVLTVAR